MNDKAGSSKISPALIAGIVLICAILVGGFIAVFALSSSRGALSDLASAFKSETSSTTVIRGALGQLNHTPKLVVLTADVSAEVSVKSTRTWMGIDLGDTVSNVRAPARVQYVVRLEKISEKDFSYDARTKRLIVKAPRPELDREMVSVESDPSKLEVKTDVGWGRLRISSGKYTEETAKQYLKEAAIFAGSGELVRERAEKNAREQILKLLGPVAAELAPDVSLDVEFKK